MDMLSTRPRSVTLTLWGVFLLGGWNCGRLLATGLNYRFLTAFSTTPAPLFRLIMALIWLVLLWGAAIALWQRRPFTRHTIPALLTIYMAYELSVLLIFTQSEPARSGWLFNLSFYLGLIGLSYWALNRTAVASYFRE